MKKSIWICVIGLILFSCSKTDELVVSVSNPLSFDRMEEMVEIPLSDVQAKLQINDAQFVITNAQGEDVSYQLTSDGQIIFQVSVPAGGETAYSINKGVPAPVPTIACGKHYPERVDDIAWENDLVAFRTYGPALQKSGERAFGYDLWTKRDTKKPVVAERYAKDLNPEIDYSYHKDYGNGLDCYKVGPTLGGGTAALMVDGNIIYPYCYKNYKILDNGPLRFSVQLIYNPLTVGGKSDVVETRTITLDAGSYLNKTSVVYAGLNKTTDVVTGIVLHQPEGEGNISRGSDNDYMSYVDPTDNPNAGNGLIFVGAVFPRKAKEIDEFYFSKEEREEERGGADGHLLAISDYQPGGEYAYFWGSSWDKTGMSLNAWNNYLKQFVDKLANPLVITWE